ncbi:translocon-associated protein subunit alpha-like isoform X2 [Lineus longissimus]|uniref:translocon-associated protein subunit alpha-like isoform X2 n=1 Tax=Lineus longissimus TaxID=88925 RepID=UPI002B4F22FA
MAKLLGRFLLMLLLVLPSSIMFTGNDGHSSFLVNAEDPITNEDEVVDDETEDATVESPEDATPAPTETPGSDVTEGEAKPDEETTEEKPLKPSPNADTKILFTKPTNMEFPAGVLVKILVGFTNKGETEFMVDSMDAAFRYPQDYSYYIQNFTAVRFDATVAPKRQHTFEYSFTPSDQFTARPFGLTVNLNYKDSEGTIFQDAVFNDTVNIVELDEGLDGETFFLYVFLAAVVVLLLVGAQQLLSSFSKKRLSRPKQQRVEMGTQNNADVDYDWIPDETLKNSNKSPRAQKSQKSPKQSPRQRRTKRSTGADE